MIKSSKATKEQLRRHNRQLLLHAVYSGLANTRVALAQETNLAKPTVSDLIAELIDDGLLVEVGHGESTESGGKRPRLLQFVPDARNIIGIALTETQITGILTNLNGQITAQHFMDITNSREPILDSLVGVINGLIAQLDAPLLCLGLGVPSTANSNTDVIRFIPHLGWPDIPLAKLLDDGYRVPIYVENNTKLAAMAQFAFDNNHDFQSLVTVQINHTVEIGYILGGGAYHNGGDVSSLIFPVAMPDNGRLLSLDSYLGWLHVKQRVALLRQEYPDSTLPTTRLSYLHILYCAIRGDEAALLLFHELADHLAYIFAWTIALLRPEHITLAGGISDMGQEFLNCAIEKTRRLVDAPLVEAVSFSIALQPNLSALGAVAQALQRDLGFIS